MTDEQMAAIEEMRKRDDIIIEKISSLMSSGIINVDYRNSNGIPFSCAVFEDGKSIPIHRGNIE